MSYGHPALENDIKTRELWLLEALSASSPDPGRYSEVRKQLQQEARDVPLPMDQSTWFALQRLGVKTGQPTLIVDQAGAQVPAGALVWVDPELEPNPDTARALKAASFIVAPESWRVSLGGLPTYFAPLPAPEEPVRRPRAPGM